MGLDITYYRKLRPAPGARFNEDTYEPEDANGQASENLVYVNPVVVKFTETNWPGRSAGVESGKVYAHNEDDYDAFCPGSYGNYNRWREDLRLFALDRGDAFAELINFADNEGVIGPVVSAKLARDFAEHATAYAVGHDSYYIEKYVAWQRAFEFAADGGAVLFH